MSGIGLYPILKQELPSIPISPGNSYVQPVTPKNTPRYDVNFLSAKAIPTLPTRLPLLPKRVMLPLVRRRGVVKSIYDLGKIFNLTQYEYNHITFWYLDILADCLWRLQDDYKLPLEFQRIGLSWIIFFLSILKDSNVNYNRDEIFTILKEFVMLAGETMDEGDPYLPRPENLAKLLTIEDCFQINQMHDTNADSNNAEIEYIDLRNGAERSLFIMKPSQYVFSSESKSSDSTSSSLSQISPIEISEDSVRDEEIEEEQNSLSIDQMELDQNADMEKLSIKTMLAVIDYIFEFFYNDFQYSLIRAAVINPPNFVEEKIEEFHFPKRLSEFESIAEKSKTEKQTKSKSQFISHTSIISTPPSFGHLLDTALQTIREHKRNLLPLKDAELLIESSHSVSFIN